MLIPCYYCHIQPDIAHKMYFWNGCLVTRYGEHFIGDIKVKRSYHDVPLKVTVCFTIGLRMTALQRDNDASNLLSCL